MAANPAEAIALQKKTTMKATGSPQIDPAVVNPDFPNSKLPGVEAFDKTEEILASEADLNPGMIDVRDKARAVAKAAADPAQRRGSTRSFASWRSPRFSLRLPKMGKQVNGWVRPRIIGNYRSDYVMRSITNYAGIWANNSKEVVYFTAQGLDGSQTFTQTYPKDALPLTSKTRYFWSVVVVDGVRLQSHPQFAQPLPAQQAVAVKTQRRRFTHAGSSRPSNPTVFRNQTGCRRQTAKNTI